MFPEFFPSLLLKDRVLICRSAIKRSILAQYIIPYFKADISLFPTGDRLTQISLYKFAASWLTEQSRQI